MQPMNNARIYTNWGLAGLFVLVSPIVVIFAVPLAIGIGFDILKTIGEVPIALALFAPVAYVLVRLLSPLHLLRHLAAALTRPASAA
jgi:hypothetical protein